MTSQRFHLPSAPSDPPPNSFPVFAVLAPVVGALVMFAILQSPYVLMFAVLSPIIAIASTIDGRMARRRHRRLETGRFDGRAERLREAVDKHAEAALQESIRQRPEARALLRRDDRHPERWRWKGGSLPATLGIGPMGGRLPIDEPQELEGLQRELYESLQSEHRKRRGPVAIDVADGVGVYGEPVAAQAIARGLLAQVLEAVPPEGASVMAPETDAWNWLAEGAHPIVRAADDGSSTVIRVLTDSGDFTVATAAERESLPRECRIRLDASLAGIDTDEGRVLPFALSRHDAAAHVRLLSTAARAAGMQAAGAIPSSVDLGDLIEGEPGSRGALAARFLVGQSEIDVDIVADGPHAVVGGTTGSGKSELLIAWVCALANAYSSAELNVLLVDFKGGASFAGLEDLQHCVGLMTDLDEAGALRAIESLRSELRRRERVLAAEGVRSVEETSALPRLLVVVDEFAAMLQEHPDLHRLFVDIAARGRSLGVHLVLCTQRPADAVRDALLTNCGLRICLRVNDDADSVAVVGAPDAARIPLEARGRCIVQISGRSRTAAQAALAGPEVIGATVQRSKQGPRPRRPYLPPLPKTIEARDIKAAARDGGVVFAVADRPGQQRQDAVQWAPEDGSVLVLGGAGCGKTTLAGRFAEAKGSVFVNDVEALWDVLDDPADASVIVVDDLDLLLMQAGDEHAHDITTALARRMREGRGRGRAFVLAARRTNGAIANAAGLAELQIVMRMPTRQEHMLADASGEFDSRMQPGGAWLLGERVQAVRPGRQPTPLPAARKAYDFSRCAVVAAHPETLPIDLGRAVAPGAVGDLVVGTPAQWEQAWGALDAIAAERPVVLADVTDRQLRSLWRSAVRLPICQGPGRWLVEGGRATRLQW
ncbi:FtsK/SpoIIIE domain-containing protein [Agrococcus casei]|uniref:FtsK/SpoIIIE domain-containing protein n=1 Tax=Agrococcus casei TaxID=343512 RepID=UPI003F92D469